MVQKKLECRLVGMAWPFNSTDCACSLHPFRQLDGSCVRATCRSLTIAYRFLSEESMELHVYTIRRAWAHFSTPAAG
jgi:hypothetical protein